MPRPREIFLEFDAESFGSGAHDEWYRSVERLGDHGRFDLASACGWWDRNVEPGSGYHSFGMPYASTWDELALAFESFMAMTREALRDRAKEEYAEPENPARPASRWERVNE